MAQKLAKALHRILPEARVETSRAERLCYSYDATRLKSVPDAVVFPETAEEVAALVRLANDTGTPLVPRGAGTGFVGGSVPVAGGIVLSFERMNRIIEIDRENMVAVVEPGVVTADLHKAVEKLGLFYPPDPSSAASCTLGGNAACAATGPRSVKYGGTREYVLAVDAVLPTGEIVRSSSRAVKRVVGYDLARLLVGTEGTLGVIVGLTLRLLPKPAAVRTLLAAFDSVAAAARTVSVTIASGLVPRTCEFMDHRSLDMVRKGGKVNVPENARALLILEVDGSKTGADQDAKQLEKLCEDEGAVSVTRAKNAAEVTAVWSARKALSQAMYEVADTKINEDVVVPRNRLPELVKLVDDLAERYHLPIVSFGHAGEGNLHVNVMVDKKNRVDYEKAVEAVRALFEGVVKMGGSVSGEHGIGLAKADYLPIEAGMVGIEVMRRIKQAMDPANILNPWKIFDSPTGKEAGAE